MLVNILDSNSFGGPFNYAFGAAAFVEKHDLSPEEYEIKNDTRQVKQRIDSGEIEIPCGEAVFDEQDAEMMIDKVTENGIVHVAVWMTCQECNTTFQWSGNLGGPSAPDCGSLDWSIVHDV